jgi:hypothetical protein
VVNAVLSEAPGARESNAGDDFHFLWTVRACLQMLRPGSPLRGIQIEGVGSTDRAIIADDDLLLGADLTEYFGALDFKSADRVVVSQLKYSTRHPGREWTAARLNAGAAKDKAVIRRLADIVAGYLQAGSPADVLGKLRVRLVSNQPVAPELLRAVEDAQAVINSKGIRRTADLLKELSQTSRPVIEELYRASSARSETFVVFLAVFDLSQCGAASRALLGVDILRQLGISTPNPGDDLRRLYDLVRDMASPERSGMMLTRGEVMAALGLGTDAALFPAPPRLEMPADPVPTEDATRVAEFVRANKGRQIVVHGPAGIGKTTTMLQMQAHLPEGAEAFLYDCFGGGEYLDLGKERHRSEECFVQLANEAAVRLGTPLLLRRPNDPINAGKAFVSRVEAASKLVGSDDLFVIIIDAADNAVTAAQDTNSPCFVSDLRRFVVPANCCIVYSCRTHRKEMVDEGGILPHLELRGFDASATSAFVTSVIPTADDQLCREVHERSAGVPRFQSYLLDLLTTELSKDESLREGTDGTTVTADVLKTVTARTLEELFEGRVREAEGVLAPLVGDHAGRKSLLTDLMVLARPLTIDDLATFARVPVENVERFCRALVPGLVLDGRAIRFRDENFETYLRSKVSDAERAAAVARLADTLFAQCDTHLYAALHVSDYLLAAARWQDAVALALAPEIPGVIADEVTRLNVRLRRNAAGLSACAKSGDFVAAGRILLRAGEAKRTSESVFALVREFPDLATLHGDIERLGELYMRQQEETVRADGAGAWLGAAHLRVAAIYARRPELRQRAIDHLNAASSWFRLREAVPERERHGWDITDADIASQAEAVYHLFGPERAVRTLLRWRPLDAVLEAARICVGQMAEHLREEDKAAELLDAAEAALPYGMRTWGLAYLAACLWDVGVPLPPEMLERIAARVERAATIRTELPVLHDGYRQEVWTLTGWRVTFIEALVYAGTDPSRVERLLAYLAPERPRFAPHFGNRIDEWEAFVRGETLRACLAGKRVTLNELRPAEWPDIEAPAGHKQERRLDVQDANAPRRIDEDDIQRFREFVGRLLPVCEVWADSTAAARTVSEIKDRALACVSDGGGWSRYEADAFTFPYRCRTAWAAIVNCTDFETAGAAEAMSAVAAIRDEIGRREKVPKTGCWLDLARVAARKDASRNAALELLEHVGAYLEAEPMRASERWDVAMRCARAALPYSRELCGSFYERGLKAAADVDDESIPFIASICALSQSLAKAGSQESRARLAAKLRTVAEAYRLRLSEETRLPWDEVLQAIAALDIREGLATCHAWDVTEVRGVDLCLPTVAAEGVRQESLGPVAAVGLLALARDDWYDPVERYGPDGRFGASVAYKAAVSALKRASGSDSGRNDLNSALEEIAGRILRDFRLESRGRIAAEFCEWAAENGISGEAVARLRAAAEFHGALPEKPSSSGYDDAEWKARMAADRAEARRKQDEAIWAARRGDLSVFARQVNAAWLAGYDQGVRRFVLSVAEGLPYALRPKLMAELVRLIPETYGTALPRVSEELLARWKTHPRVAAETAATVEALVGDKLRDVIHRFPVLARLAGGLSRRLLTTYLEEVGLHLAEWGSASLFAAYQHVSQSLAAEDRWTITEEGADHLISKVKGTVEVASTPTLPEHTVADFLFAMCGHPKADTRWDALHAARFVAANRPAELLPRFTALTELESGPEGYALAGRPFHWMTARTYGLILLDRLASEAPDIVRPYTPVLKRHLRNASFPHAQAREMAKRALLSLARRFPSDLPPDEVREIERSNSPKACILPKGQSFRSGSRAWPLDREPDKGGARFKFDSMDIIPYWFNPAARIFSVSGKDFVASAGEWAAVRWGHSNVFPNWNEGTRHGSLPRVETPDTYVSYHAMMCVMGTLVDAAPVAVPDYDYGDEPVPCPWDEWLEDHLPPDRFWLSDLRTPTPFEPELWQEPHDADAWVDTVSEPDFTHAIAPPTSTSGEWTMLYSSVEYHSSSLYASTSVLSALVLDGTASSLLRALGAADPMRWSLPVEGWPSSDEWIVNEPGFVLEPALRDPHDCSRLGQQDPRAADVPSEGPMGPSDTIMANLGLVPSADRREYRDARGDLVAKAEVWSDNPKLEKTYTYYTSGTRLWMRADALRSHLAATDRALIYSVTIRRDFTYEHRRYSGRSRERNDQAREWNRVQFLRRDGTIEVAPGRRQPGAADS